jgi:hypothetical protein
MKRLSLTLALICFIVTSSVTSGSSQVAGQKSPINITLTVENEGPGGLFSQLGADLNQGELAEFHSAIEKKILGFKMKHRLVPQDYDKSHFFLSIIVTKLELPGGRNYFAVSSALSIGKVKGNIESLTHDVIVEPSLQQMASAIGYYLSTAELRGVLKLDK